MKVTLKKILASHFRWFLVIFTTCKIAAAIGCFTKITFLQ